MNHSKALILAATILPFVLPTVVDAKPASTVQRSEWREIRRDENRGWQAEKFEDGQRIVVTGFEQNGNAVVIGVVYNRNGSVQSSDRVNLSRDRRR